MRYGHLERVEVVLRTLAPVFIGSGESLTKKEYIFDRANRRIHLPHLPKLAAFLASRSLLPAFEAFLLRPGESDLRAFLQDNGVGPDTYSDFTAYTIDAGEAAAEERFRGVLMFVKGPDGLPYIPGSSLKGAIRTAIAAGLAAGGNYEREAGSIVRAVDDPRGNAARETESLERKMFGRLKFEDPRRAGRPGPHDPVNDFLRGVRVSDSAPVGLENLTLCGKYDRKPDGFVKPLPVYRECLRPGAEVRFALTLDRPMLAGVDVKYIEKALRDFAAQHYADFERHFRRLPEDARTAPPEGVDIIIGGGAGYVSKTIAYPLLRGRALALRVVSKIMRKQFRLHRHEKDPGEYGVSPHTLKTARYRGAYYQMGRCRLIFR